jgi:pimeloyl-ACP methyl ester carboxylesterase
MIFRCTLRSLSLLLLLTALATHAATTGPTMRYIVLEGAVEQTGTDPKREKAPIIFYWDTANPSYHNGALVLGETSDQQLSIGTVAAVGDRFTGRLYTKVGHDEWKPWTFSGPMAPEGGSGDFEFVDGPKTLRGRVSVIPYYEARQSDSHRAISVWLPPGPEPVRGLLIWGNAANSDGMRMLISKRWRAFCQLHRFAFVTTSHFDLTMGGMDGGLLLTRLADVAARSGHEELNSAPVIFTGHSFGGAMAWEFNAAHPQRTIAFSLSRFGGDRQLEISPLGEKAQATPAILIGGERDGLSYGVTQKFQTYQKGNRAWIHAVEPEANHNFGRADDDLLMAFFDWAIRARVPVKPGDPLREIDLHSGWWGNKPSSAPEWTYARADPNSASPSGASWLPTETMAQAWSGYCTPKNPALELETSRVVFAIGDMIPLRVVDASSVPWEEIQVLVNDKPAGNFNAANRELSLKANAPGVYVATARTRLKDGRIVFGQPTTWVVTSK